MNMFICFVLMLNISIYFAIMGGLDNKTKYYVTTFITTSIIMLLNVFSLVILTNGNS